jgi:ribonucleoside-diphosphate reductase alpha chain
MNSVVKLEHSDVNAIPFQEASLDIWDKKYRLTSKDGKPVDGSMDDTYKRVARALADVERPELREQWCERFLWALRHGAIPAGRVTSNAGALEHKPATSTINCTVSGTIHDSMNDILGKVHEAGLTLKAGCGIGYEFSTLRPRGAYVSGAGAYTSGPLSFMDIYDKMCFTVSSAGGRRGAQMGTFDVGHPDALDFIRAKRENGRLRQFNLSLLVTDEFIQAVREEREWRLAFPLSQSEFDAEQPDLRDADKFVWREWPVHEGYVVNDAGLVACRVYKKLPARRMWDVIMSSTYDFAEPGFILIDRVNEMNNNWWCENIRATNPCGEQPLPPYGSCLLGSVNLTRFVRAPFSSQAHFDWDEYREVVRIFTRALDNVVEINGLPLQQQRDEIMRKRRHGMGFLGLGSTITLLGMKYGSPESVQFTEDVSREMALAGWEAGLELAREKGPAPIMNEEFTVTAEMLRKRPEMERDGWKSGARIPGRLLHARYSRYMQRIAGVAPQLVEQLAQVGARFTHHTSIAPTGTISLSLANNASNGIEPSFAHHYYRNVIRSGRKSKDRRVLLRAAGLPRAGQPARHAGRDQRGGGAAREFHHHQRCHAAPARRHPGRLAEVDRFLDLQDGQRADRFPLRAVQGHLSLCPRTGAQGLHHLPLQSGGPPGRAGQGRRPAQHFLRVHAGRWHRGRGAR